MDTFAQPSVDSSVTTTSSPSGSMVSTFASVVGSVRTNRVVVVTVARRVPTLLASSSSPTTTYSALTYPFTFPDVIRYHPSSVVSSTVAADLS